ncbi:MAG: hypothetical protein U1E67_16065 [Hyphomicrobiales bacterium]
MNTVNSSTQQTPAETNKIILKDIKAKWDKFSEQDLTALKNKDELVTQVMSKYNVEKPNAVRDVDALLKGREFKYLA